jgi:ligand-binding sensor domain-containing protein
VVDESFIWFGTKERGLRRYDKSNDKWQLFYSDYMASYWRPSYRIENIPANCALPDNRISDLAIDNGWLWIASGGGLCGFHEKEGKWIVIKEPYVDRDLKYESGYENSLEEIIGIAVDKNSVWCGTSGAGVIRYIKPSRETQRDYINGSMK